jgi:hypothetical protein
MAQTKPKSSSKPKAKSKPKASKSSASKSAKPASKSKSKSASKPKSTKSKAKSSKSKASKPRSSSNGASAKSSSNGSSSKHSNVEAVKNAVGGAGQTVGKVASKAKVPLVAGGAAIAGAAGGMALAASKKGRKSGIGKAISRRPKVKVSGKDVAKAAKEVGNFSAQVGELATELQRARESANGNGGSSKHRSPVEVVLQGLTARR